jgi:hypothetical protein
MQSLLPQSLRNSQYKHSVKKLPILSRRSRLRVTCNGIFRCRERQQKIRFSCISRNTWLQLAFILLYLVKSARYSTMVERNRWNCLLVNTFCCDKLGYRIHRFPIVNEWLFLITGRFPPLFEDSQF